MSTSGSTIWQNKHPLKILLELVAQAFQSFGDFFAGMSGQILRASVHLNAGNDSRVGEDFDEGSAVFILPTDGLVAENRATDTLTKTRRGHNQFPIGLPGCQRLRNVELCEAFKASGIAFIHRQQPFVVRDQCLCSVR
jgi:hypothetical protein